MIRFLLHRRVCAWLGGTLLLLATPPVSAAERSDAEPAPRFAQTIRPILARHCYQCHGPDKQEGGLRLDHHQGATATLESGQIAVVAGQVASSALLARVASTDPGERMPPDDRPALSAEQVAALRAWIAAGASWEEHWAYQPPLQAALPAVRATAWMRNEIDLFVLSRLEAEGIVPSAEADRATLLRRVSLDLIGLPPKPEELDAFLSDTSSDAYERVVDRLLASPQYGVRQASLWLDLARYADSNGYPHDAPRSVWPYRDWVVEAFNADLPFDQFTIEQLAGDRLPEPTQSQLIATGFHRNTRINTEAGVDPEEFRLEAVHDRVNTTATVWLGSTLACAQCHDHKYDPFAQADYYRFLAFFNQGEVETTRDASGNITDVSPRLEFWTPAQQAKRVALEEQIAAAKVAGDATLQADLAKQLAAITPTKALVMREAETARDNYLFVRGSFLNRGANVTPGVPGILAQAAPELPGTDRLALARWLVDRRNPLTARVAVNRIWMQYFGHGFVDSPEDFGVQAVPPVHQDLLDWLAVDFMQSGWSQKALHRRIVTSATFRQSSRVSEAALQRDPQNRKLARGARLRLPAEVVRDNALAIGGILTLELGGSSVFAPGQRADAADPARRYRRMLYSNWKRQALDDTLVNFDAPSRDVVCARRVRTNTPLQALNLLNDRAFLDAARGLANQVLAESGDFDARLNVAFRRAVARPPQVEEVALLTDLYTRRRAALSENPALAEELIKSGSVAPAPGIEPVDWAAWTLVANVLLNLDETATRP